MEAIEIKKLRLAKFRLATQVFSALVAIWLGYELIVGNLHMKICISAEASTLCVPNLSENN